MLFVAFAAVLWVMHLLRSGNEGHFRPLLRGILIVVAAIFALSFAYNNIPVIREIVREMARPPGFF